MELDSEDSEQFNLLLVPLVTLTLYHPVKTILTESQAEAQEPTYITMPFLRDFDWFILQLPLTTPRT